ncbi:hypothetical protein [Streptomyces sp. V3I7]|uniref:hypothetical protein n=1 Tax=Streptomyces sp. V3I7 TaxID=3042278 RepID=UPI002784D3D3|nr:hypothetical protein [Streptomyces sp. V3I7]MDQ0989477.1 hypothetical protein [Streptomyces sp. V3I7]
MPPSRSLAALIGLMTLGVALTACEDNAAGQVVARNGDKVVETVSNPPNHGCHRFPEGVTHVNNHTQSNLLLYTTPNCTVPPGGQSIYLDMGGADEVVRGMGLWRSFSIAPGG